MVSYALASQGGGNISSTFATLHRLNLNHDPKESQLTIHVPLATGPTRRPNLPLRAILPRRDHRRKHHQGLRQLHQRFHIHNRQLWPRWTGIHRRRRCCRRRRRWRGRETESAGVGPGSGVFEEFCEFYEGIYISPPSFSILYFPTGNLRRIHIDMIDIDRIHPPPHPPKQPPLTPPRPHPPTPAPPAATIATATPPTPKPTVRAPHPAASRAAARRRIRRNLAVEGLPLRESPTTLTPTTIPVPVMVIITRIKIGIIIRLMRMETGRGRKVLGRRSRRQRG